VTEIYAIYDGKFTSAFQPCEETRWINNSVF
jgi:hypothetical protein